MNPDQLTTILLFAGFNEVTLPEGARLLDVHVDGYQVSLAFKTSASAPSVYRQFYVAFNSAPTDYTQGVLQLIKKIDFADGTSTAMIYEVYPYDEEV